MKAKVVDTPDRIEIKTMSPELFKYHIKQVHEGYGPEYEAELKQAVYERFKEVFPKESHSKGAEQ